MTLWKPASVEQEPQTTLTRWAVREVNIPAIGHPTIHFVGDAGYEGRVCSPVIEFDMEKMRGVTRSGRVYELSGPPGTSSDAEYVWFRWIQNNRDPEWRDITEDFWSEDSTGE